MLMLSLPFDMLERILLCCDVRDILICSSACKALRSVVTTSLQIRYPIALAARGMRDGANDTLSLAEKLEKLERYELAWRKLAWTQSMSIDLPVPSKHVYQADGFLLIINPVNSAVKVIRLPSPLRGVSYEEFNWAAPPEFVGGDHETVLMDPRHDLVAFLKENVVGESFDIHARSLTTGATHPLTDGRAIVQVFASIYPLNNEAYESFCMSGRYMILLESFDVSEVMRVYDWTTGVDLTPPSSPPHNAQIQAFMFLDDARALALVSLRNSALPQPLELWVMDLERLHAQGFATTTHIFDISLRSSWQLKGFHDHLGTRMSRPLASRGELDDGCYFDEDQCTLSNVRFAMWTDGNESQDLVLRVHLARLLHFADQEPANAPVRVPFATWNEPNMLLEEPSHLGNKNEFMSGARLIEIDGRHYTVIMARDFNPRRSKWLQHVDPASLRAVLDTRELHSSAGHMRYDVSGDCLVAKEDLSEDLQWNDRTYTVHNITVYSFT